MNTVARFQVDYRQLLDERGRATAELPAFARDAEEMRRMYRAMTLARVFDAKAVNLQRTGQLGTYASSLGHEATHVGVGAAMHAEDVLAPVYREYGTQLWRGVTMREILLYWGGDERGNDFAGPRADFAWCVPIATQTLHAAGAAMTFKIRGRFAWPSYRSVNLADPLGFTEEQAQPIFDSCADFGDLLDGLESLSANEAIPSDAITVN